jgi:transcriptional regulator with XRE-family HTH domain
MLRVLFVNNIVDFNWGGWYFNCQQGGLMIETEMKRKIRAAGLTVAELASLAKIPNGTLACYLNGVAKMPDGLRERIEKLLSVKYFRNSVVFIPNVKETKK